MIEKQFFIIEIDRDFLKVNLMFADKKKFDAFLKLFEGYNVKAKD